MGVPRQLRFDASERWLLAVLVVVLGYFHGGASWNQNSRLDAIFAFVESGTPDFLSFRIDRFLIDPERNVNTGDWARAHGHYYSNKLPGPMLLAIPWYGLLYAGEQLLGLHAGDLRLQIANAYLINLWTSVLVVALGALAFRRVLLRVGTDKRIATLLTLATVLSTGLFPYATQLWGHCTAAGLVAIALWAYVLGTPASLIAAGAAAGGAVLCDPVSIVFALGLCVLAAVRQRGRALLVVVGGAVPALVLMGYDAACFGSPFALPATHGNPAFLRGHGTLGPFHAPSAEALLALLFGPQRGILLQMPLLAFAFVGFGRWYRRDRGDGLLWLCGGSVLVSLLANSALEGAQGGATVLARHLIPCLPLLCVALKEIPPYGLTGRLISIVGLLSLANMLAIAAVNPVCPNGHANPLHFTYAQLSSGNLAPYPFPIRLQELEPSWPQVSHLAMWNWGQLAGLHGLWSLLPLAAIGLVALRLRPEELRRQH